MADRTLVMTRVFQMISGMAFVAPVMGKTGWVTKEQRLRLWSDVPSEQQPYVALVTHSEVEDKQGLGLTRVTLNLAAYIYTRAPKGVIGQTDLDTIMTTFENTWNAAVDNFSTNEATLGNLVYWCRIQGKVFKDPGDLDEQTLLVVPIVVEMP